MRVLIIDDDAHIRSALRRLLFMKFRAVVDEAPNGLLGFHHLLKNPCDLVLLDLHMRTMDGLETLRAIRKSPEHVDLPVMMLTGDSEEDAVVKALEFGVVDFLIKPLDATILFERIAATLTRVGRPDLLVRKA